MGGDRRAVDAAGAGPFASCPGKVDPVLAEVARQVAIGDSARRHHHGGEGRTAPRGPRPPAGAWPDSLRRRACCPPRGSPVCCTPRPWRAAVRPWPWMRGEPDLTRPGDACAWYVRTCCAPFPEPVETSMSLLKTIDPNPSFAPQESGPLPERLISGDPTYKTWAQDAARGETIKTGVWEATPGETHSIKGELFEPHPFRRHRTHAGRRRAGGLQGRRQLCHEAGLRRCLEDHRNRAQDLPDRFITPAQRSGTGRWDRAAAARSHPYRSASGSEPGAAHRREANSTRPDR